MNATEVRAIKAGVYPRLLLCHKSLPPQVLIIKTLFVRVLMLKKSLISGTLILMGSAFIVRILGFFYRIYLSNLIGAEGMGLFQLIFPVYSLIILTLTSGISIAVSKMVAGELARNHMTNLRRITNCALALIISLGTVVSLFCFTYGEFLANVVLKDPRTYFSIMLLIPCIPVIAAASALKGYFYGIQNTVPTAVSQIVEQIVRIGLVMATAGWFLRAGLEYACAIATFGMALGEIANLTVLYLIYGFRKSRAEHRVAKSGLLRKRVIFRELIIESLPISFNRFIISAMSAVENILIPARMLAGGLSHQQSLGAFGRLAGMAMPLLFFPSIVTSSLATTLVPAISEAMSLRNYRSVNHMISKAIRLTFIMGLIVTAVFISYPNEIGNMIYRKQNIGPMLYILSFTCIFIYLQQTLLGILNGLGKQGISLVNSVIGSVIRIGFVYFCIPSYGISGYVYGIITSSACVSILNLYAVYKTTGIVLDFRNWIFKPGLAGVVMVFSGKCIYRFFTVFNLGHILTTILTVGAYVCLAVCLMKCLGVLEKGELAKLLGIKNR